MVSINSEKEVKKIYWQKIFLFFGYLGGDEVELHFAKKSIGTLRTLCLEICKNIHIRWIHLIPWASKG